MGMYQNWGAQFFSIKTAGFGAPVGSPIYQKNMNNVGKITTSETAK
jgi:hypothetical protein